jgi:predicted dehydrogenase
MNRREFTRLSALAAASTRLPDVMGQASSSPQRPVGFAVVGIGSISTAFMEACAGSANVKIAALVTGHPETKGVQFGKMYNVPQSNIYTYETFDRIRDNPAIDAVYIGLPNNMHREYTVRAAQAGKHVLCEKPMAISSAECRTMIEACRKADRRLMIAYRMQYDPIWQQAFDIVRSGALGKVQSCRGNFLASQTVGAWRLTKKYGGGGSLMDVGIYPLNGIRYLLQENPSEFTAVAATRDRDDPRFAEVEQSLEWTMKFPSGIIASCGCSYGQFGPATLSVHGDQGYIAMSQAFGSSGIHLTGTAGAVSASGSQMAGTAGSQRFDQTSTGKAHFQLGLEGEHFAACVRNGTQPKSPGEEGLADMLAIEGIYKAAGTPIA